MSTSEKRDDVLTNQDGRKWTIFVPGLVLIVALIDVMITDITVFGSPGEVAFIGGLLGVSVFIDQFTRFSQSRKHQLQTAIALILSFWVGYQFGLFMA